MTHSTKRRQSRQYSSHRLNWQPTLEILSSPGRPCCGRPPGPTLVPPTNSSTCSRTVHYIWSAMMIRAKRGTRLWSIYSSLCYRHWGRKHRPHEPARTASKPSKEWMGQIHCRFWPRLPRPLVRPAHPGQYARAHIHRCTRHSGGHSTAHLQRRVCHHLRRDHRCIRSGDVQYRLRTMYRPVLTRVPPPGKDRQRRGGRCRFIERHLRDYHRAADIWTAPVGAYSIVGADLSRPSPIYRPRCMTISAYFTRSTYCPERVSMRILSPGLINKGTFTTAPVSRVAGLVTLVAVSPRTPGSALTTSSSRKFGSSTAMIFSPSTSISTTSCSLRNFTASPSISFGSGC